MSISITINNINTLSDTEREVLRLIAGNEASVADTLKATVRGIAAQPDIAVPIEPTKALSPHTLVIDPPAPPAAPANPHFDSAGLPWDKRIHSSARGKLQDGTWRYARGVDKALIATVEAELRAVQAIPAPVAPAPADDGSLTGDFMRHEQAAPTGWPFGTVTPEAQDAAAVVQDVAPAPIVPLPPVVPPAPTALPMTFAQLMQHVTPLLVSGKLTQPVLQQAVEKCGLPHLAALGARPDLVETVRTAIDEAVGGVQ